MISSLKCIIGILLLGAAETFAWISTSSTTSSALARSAVPSHRISPDCSFFSTLATNPPRSWTVALSTSTTLTDVVENNNSNNNDAASEGDEEWEYVEYEMLKEVDFMGSEWLVGTSWDSNRNKIDETWCRLATDRDGKNVAIWGDKSEGTWNFDVASQFLSFSKESLFGKQIWAGVVDDYYFCRGTVRGWTYLTPASVLAQWQAKRLGVDPEEAGTPPWFGVQDDESVSTDESNN